MKWFLLLLILALGAGLSLLVQGGGSKRQSAGILEAPTGGRVRALDPEAVQLASATDRGRAEVKTKWRAELDDYIALQDEQFMGLPHAVHDPYKLKEEMIRGAEENYASQWLLDENGERVRHGPWESNHLNGRVEELGAYDQGKEQGLWQWWYEDGTPQAVGQFEAGKRVGSWTWYHENGALMMTGAYEDGEGSGEWVYYHDNGLVRGRGAFIDDEINGAWQFWHEDGSVDEERTGIYEDGELSR